MRLLRLVGGVLAVPLCVGCGGSEFSSAGETGGSSSAGSSSGGSAAGGSSSGGNSSGGSAAGGSSAGGSAAGGAGGTNSGGSAGSFPGGSGGDGGSAASGGMPSGGSSSGGTGGSMGCPTECEQGEYCDEDTSKCARCDAVDVGLRFGPPTRLPLNISAGVDDRFPRVSDDQTLWYTRGDGDGSYSVVKLAKPYTGAPTVVHQNASGFLPRGIDGEGLSFEAAFDAKESTGTRRLIGVNADLTTSPLGSLNQVNGAGVTSLDYSIAVGNGRVWWMSDRLVVGQAGGPHLHTGQPGIVFNIAYVPLLLQDGCPAQGRDLSPWVGKLGNLMFFAAQPLSNNGDCVASVDGAPRDLYWTLVDNTGQQMGLAQRIDISDAMLDDTEPSLSPDLCTLMFSRSENGASEAHDIYTATRR